MSREKTPDSTPVKFFRSSKSWAAWLDDNHSRSTGLWVRIAKKNATARSVTYAEALEVALCYGWIDGQKKPQDEEAWLQKFLPRSNRSLWSKINREKAEALITGGHMKAAGLAAVQMARANGRWEAAYDSPGSSTVPEDFGSALNAHPKAKRFFENLDRANRYAVLWRIQTVKRAETRARKIEQFIAMLEREEKIHS